VLARKNPVGLISFSTSAGSAPPRSRAVGERRDSSGVTRLTERSVVWAERMVAISSSKGFWWTSSVTAGYRSRSRSTVRAALVLAPRGGAGVIHDFFLVLGAKQPARHRGDLRAIGAPGQPCRRRLHDSSEALRTVGLHLGDRRANLRLDLQLAHSRGQEGA